ncbi:efflux RND transporter periplasmic adaptor subunit [Thermostilla marina]
MADSSDRRAASGVEKATETAPGKQRPSAKAWWVVAAFILGAVVGAAACVWTTSSETTLFAAIAASDHTDGPVTGHDVDLQEHSRRHAEEADHDHAPGEACNETHEHEGESEPHGEESATILELSEQARRNIGLQVVTVARGLFVKRKSVPAVVVEVPGRSRTVVSAPITGIIERVEPVAGQGVAPGDPLFTLRLTHEDLVEKQSRFLESLEAADVVRREIARLEQVTQSGVVAGKQLLERKYELEKLEASLHAAREALLLHGLSASQIDEIARSRRLLQRIMIVAPPLQHDEASSHEAVWQIADLAVQPGVQVEAGAVLCELVDSCRLWIEGQAFETDTALLQTIMQEQRPVDAALPGDVQGTLSGLHVLAIDNEIDEQTRALRFYVEAENEVISQRRDDQGRRFVVWRLRPGQRGELLLPAEYLPDVLILPGDAVIEEGLEQYVYREHEGHFERVSVHLLQRDREFAAIDDDGSIAVGDRVAAAGAFQIHQAIKNRNGPVIDPHAGHNH